MTSTQQPTPVASNPQTQPVQYYVVQGQPQQQQQQQQQEQPYVYQQSVPQSQYPPQEQQQFVHQQHVNGTYILSMLPPRFPNIGRIKESQAMGTRRGGDGHKESGFYNDDCG
ncbi:hypothetical protein MMC22_006564 [Lobaria immixta]|nr:hypothetical protein [Lobaria immixta]